MFNKNIEALKKSNPDLAKRLTEIKLEDTQKDVYALEAESKDYIIAYNDVVLDNLKNPIEYSEMLWKTNVAEELAKNDIVIIFGTGLGYLFKRSYISCPSKILLFEPKINVLRFVFEYVDFSEQLEDKRVYITDSINQLTEYLSEKYLAKDKVKLLYTQGYINISAQELKEISRSIADTCESKNSDVNTIEQLSSFWIDNMVANIKHLSNSRPLTALKDKFKGKTALAIAAGPSLKNNIETIKKNRNKYVLFAVNKVAEYLMQNDIIPDFLVSADARWVDKTLKPIENVTPQINLIATTKADKDIHNYKFKNIFTYYQNNNAFDEKLNEFFPEDIKLYETEGLVTSQCYYSMIEMGFSKIIFTGLDLAMKGKTAYAYGEESIPMDYKIIAVSNQARRVVEIKSFTGEMLETRDDYALFIKQLERAFSKNTSATLYNTTDFGAYIEGMVYEPLDKILENTSELDLNLDETISNIFAQTQDKWLKIYQKQKNIIFSSKQDIENTKTKIKNYINQNKISIETLDTKIKIETINSLKQKELEIIKQIMSNLLLSSLLQIEVLKYTELYQNKDTSIDIEIKSRKHSIAMFEKMIPKIENLIEKLK